MPMWGRSDTNSNSVIWAPSQLNATPNTANRNALFGNTTSGAFVNNAVIGQFGVDATEVNVSNGSLALTYVTSGGSGYGANAVVTLTFANGTTNATAVNSTVNSTSLAGKVTSLTINAAGSGYTVNPVVGIAAPAAINIPANTTTIAVPAANSITANSTGVNSAADFILLTSANSNYLAGNRVYYTVPTNNTAITGLTANSYYYVSFANTTGLKLAATSGGANIDITASVLNETHTLTGDASFIAVSTANSKWQANDRLYYSVPTNNTAFGGLTGNSYYYVSFANTTGIKISSTSGGANLTFGAASIPTAGSPETHTIRGDTATGRVQVGGTFKGVAHAGWVLRTEGTGGRAGRVQYETLVAMGSLGAQTAAYGTPAAVADASDDTILPDA